MTMPQATMSRRIVAGQPGPASGPSRGARTRARSATRFRRGLLLVGVVALAVRGLYLWQIAQAPFFDLRLGDALTYHAWARQIAAGHWWGDEVFYQAPLYPYLLGVLYRACGDSVLAVRLLNLVLSVASCLLVAVAGRLFAGRRVGLVAGLMLACYAPAVFLDALFQKTALAAMLLAALLAALGAERRRPAGAWALVGGALLGLLALTRENALALAIVLVPWMLRVRPGAGVARRLLAVALFALGLALVLGPVALRNAALGGSWQLTTAQLGPNLYIGNNPDADGTYAPLRLDRGDPRFEREDATRLAEQALGRKLSAAEVSRYWLNRSLDYARGQPAHWLRLLGRKMCLALNAAEIPDTEDQAIYAQWSGLLRALLVPFHFGTLLPAAVLGLALGAPRRRLGVAWALAAVYTATLVAFYVFARYRFPLALLLILPASAGVVAVARRPWRWRRRHRALAAAAATLLLAAAVANAPVYRGARNPALTSVNIANALAADPRRWSDAASFYERALAIHPAYAKAHNDYGALLLRRGRPVEAIEHLAAALALEPAYSAAGCNLGLALERLGDRQGAARQYRKVLELDPQCADAHNALGTLLAEDGHLAEAIDEHRAALACDPRHAVAHNQLGVALAKSGRLAEAREHFARAVELDPAYEQARRNLEKARQEHASEPPEARQVPPPPGP